MSIKFCTSPHCPLLKIINSIIIDTSWLFSKLVQPVLFLIIRLCLPKRTCDGMVNLKKSREMVSLVIVVCRPLFICFFLYFG